MECGSDAVGEGTGNASVEVGNTSVEVGNTSVKVGNTSVEVSFTLSIVNGGEIHTSCRLAAARFAARNRKYQPRRGRIRNRSHCPHLTLPPAGDAWGYRRVALLLREDVDQTRGEHGSVGDRLHSLVRVWLDVDEAGVEPVACGVKIRGLDVPVDNRMTIWRDRH
ncbi:hypothetical protein BC936DRAFT_143230 [Jimgerdemannia flammicorona]|uniref:Uncharacterized protein n=1 Tax=Jimgerdemannia flammicorona TaxID=994334 RepID=A0A433DE50_9FUNG|nr:hypothetical protein BC936DRAFT_143230 [Jimgerdemannia flammicorona]